MIYVIKKGNIMKKQTFYQIFIFKGSKEKKVIENQGYIISLTNKFDYTTKIALYYESGSWKATHFDLGVDCTPFLVKYLAKA